MGIHYDMAKKFSEYHNRGLSKTQTMMVEDGLPPSIAGMTPEDRRDAWANLKPTPPKPQLTKEEDNMAAAKKKAVTRVPTKTGSVAAKGRKTQMIEWMKRPGGTTLAYITNETGMLPHSARALLSRIEGKQTKKVDGATIYFMAPSKKG